MATSVEERSGTIKENEDTDVCEEMQICDICGDVGYDDELALCSRCNDSAEHIYCMATMHDRVPLRWVCEQCELEEKKGSAKKRFAGNEPISPQAYKRQNTNELSSCLALTNAKNILVQEPPSKPISFENRIDIPSIPAICSENIEPNSNSLSKQNITGEAVASSSVRIDQTFSAVETQVKRGSNMSKNLSRGRPVAEACLSTPKQVALSSPTLRGPSGCLKSLALGETSASEIKTARESSIKENVDTAPKGTSNGAKFPADGHLLGSKRGFSTSVSMKYDNDQPSFLLPSRPKNLVRSKSVVERPSARWTGDKGHHNDRPLATHEHARQGTSCITDSTKSTSAGPRPYRQAGQDRNAEHERSSRDLESPHLWRHNFDSGKETGNHSPRGSDSLQHRGLNEKESRRCYRCGEVGHIAARCKNTSSGRPWESESSRGPASSEKSMVARQSAAESPLGLCSKKEEGGLKESSSWKLKDSVKERLGRIDTVNSNKEISSWKLHGAVSSGTCSKPSSNTAQQIKSSGKERLDRIHTVNSKKEEGGNLKETSSWKSHGANTSGTGSKLSSNTSQQIKNYGKEWCDRTDTANMAVKISHKSSENQVAQVQVPDGQKGNVATSSSPSISFETGKQVSIQSIATSQQAQGVDAVMDKHLQQPQPNQIVLSHVSNRCGSGTLTSTAGPDLAVDTSFDSYCEIRADPCIEMLWSGCFNVSSINGFTVYNGLQAHPSTKADPRIFEAIKTLPFELSLEEMKRGLETDTWPRSLQEQPPTSNSIGVYFFPVDMECHDIWYKPLLDHLSANDLALKTNLDLFQLLIFPSQLLPQAEQCWEDRQYLWGILRKGTSFKSLSTATPGDAL